MDPDTINCKILRIQVDKINNNNSQPWHLAANQCKCKVWELKKLFEELDAKSIITTHVSLSRKEKNVRQKVGTHNLGS